jgi:hypothetical protein
MVGGHVDPRLPHHITAGELAVEGVESSCWILFGTAVEHALEGLETTDAFVPGTSLARSRHGGHLDHRHQLVDLVDLTLTYSVPASSCIGEVGALRSRRVMLSRPSSLL